MRATWLFSILAILAASTLGVEIQCFYWNTTRGFGFLYTCRATIINVDVANPATVRNISGTHFEGKDHEDVKGFYTYSNYRNFTTIPTDIGNFFPNLEIFEWYEGNISSVDSSTFEPWPNLLVINLNGNKLVTLDGNLF